MHPLEQRLNLHFRDRALLESALLHRSFFHEHPERFAGRTSNERLEFLGDSILGFVVADWLYKRFPERSEGELTWLRSTLVRTRSLANFAATLGLGQMVQISKGEDTPQARARPALLADLFEALVGAIYLDQGLEIARRFAMPFFEPLLEDVLAGKIEGDHRTRLQELAQARLGATPRYTTIGEEGPAHQRTFTVTVTIGEEVWGQGEGLSKRAAAQAAARVAMERMQL